ncbi:MAG: TatD family hydrolase [Myxococcota bacterium]
MGLFDVHAHLTDRRLAADEAGVIDRARAAGVTTIITNGLNPADNQQVADLASRVPEVKPAFGLYPVDAVLPEMRQMGIEYDHHGTETVTADEAIDWLDAHLPEAVALGEVGLDHYWVPEELWERQEEVFRRLIRLALAHNKPIIMHSRKAERRALEVLAEEGATRVDWHCFGSKVKLGRKIAEHGHWLSIPANVARVESFQRLVETLPRDRILLETDCPYLSPDKGTLNEPANVARTVAVMAEKWGVDEGAVVDQLEANFEALFGMAP